jgi:hypothetical protein
MEPTHSLSYYLEFQRQLADSKESTRQFIVAPADHQLNPLQAGQALAGLSGIDKRMKPAGGGPDSRPIERIKGALTKIGLALLLIGSLAAFASAFLLFPTFLS